MTGDLALIRDQLNGRALELCRALLPAGRLESGQWVARNPHFAEDARKLPALKIRVAGGGNVGAWTDYRNGRDGHKGDLIGLITYCNSYGPTDTKAALAWARDFLGLKRMTRAEREAARFAAEAAKKKADRKAEQLRQRKLVEADRLFFTPGGGGRYGPAMTAGTAALGTGSPAEAHVRAYFAARACPLDEIETLNTASLRVSPATEWWRGAQWETDRHGTRHRVADGPRFPALHSAMRQWNGIVSACHVTFLDPSRPAKAPVEMAKLMFGEAKGAVIEIACGPSGKPFWLSDAAAPAPLILAEGIETAASLAGALPECRVWACGSISGFAHAPVALACVAEIYLARDTNAGNAQAQKQIDTALDTLAQHGKPLEVMQSILGDDFNDLAKGDDDDT